MEQIKDSQTNFEMNDKLTTLKDDFSKTHPTLLRSITPQFCEVSLMKQNKILQH